MHCINVVVLICAFVPLRLRLATVHPSKCVPKVCYATVSLRFTTLNSLTSNNSLSLTQISHKKSKFRDPVKHVKNTQKKRKNAVFGHFLAILTVSSQARKNRKKSSF